MSSDRLATITAFANAWEAAYSLLCEHVNAWFAAHGIDARMPVAGVTANHPGLPTAPALLDAIQKLKVATHNMRAFYPLEENFFGFFDGESIFPPAHPTQIDYQLQRLLEYAVKIGVADLWAGIIELNETCAHTFRTWLQSERIKATDETLSGRKWDILQALVDLKAFGSDSRATASMIGDTVGKEPEEDFKRPLRELVESKLIHSTGNKGGRGGGYWLTAEGLAVISQRPN